MGENNLDFLGTSLQAKWSAEDIATMQKAYDFAIKAHQGQCRKGTDIPYIVHPMEASTIAFSMTDDVNVIMGAMLHDVVEDTDYELEDIEKLFGSQVAELVDYESEHKRNDLPPEETWKIRKEEALAHLANAPIEAKIITIADKLSNMRAIKKDYQQLGEEFWQRFNQKDKSKHGWYHSEIAKLTKELADKKAYQEYVELCNEVFGQA